MHNFVYLSLYIISLIKIINKNLSNFFFNEKQKSFMQNARNTLCRKQWTIFMGKQWIVLLNAKNRFYECSKQIWIYSKHDVQSAHFINVETYFINGEKQIRSFWNLNMKKHSNLAFKIRKVFIDNLNYRYYI